MPNKLCFYVFTCLWYYPCPLNILSPFPAVSPENLDVSAAFDPNFPSFFEKKNAAHFGHGLVLNKYTGSRGKSGSNDANAEYIGHLRRIFDDNNVAFQMSELGKVDMGGGGTIAYIMAQYGMEVIDSGVAVLSMHAPYEVSSKADVYEAVKGYRAFLKNM